MNHVLTIHFHKERISIGGHMKAFFRVIKKTLPICDDRNVQSYRVDMRLPVNVPHRFGMRREAKNSSATWVQSHFVESIDDF